MYKWDADDYNKSSSEQQKWGIELLGKLSLRGDEHILDLGCGDGKITAEIARSVPYGSVLGIDKSQGMIRFANDHFPRNTFPNLAFRLSDACDMDFDQKFDIVFSNAALHWIADHPSVLQKITQGLKYGGKVIAQMGGKGNACGILKVLDAMINGEKWAGSFRNFSIPYTFYDDLEYKALLVSASLTVNRIELIPKQMEHNGREGLAAWIRTTWLPYTRRVPQEQQSDFIYDIVDKYLNTRNLGNSMSVPVEMVRLEFEAEKGTTN